MVADRGEKPHLQHPAPEYAAAVLLDVLLIGAEWRPRTLIRAQLLEEYLTVEALGSWDEAELLLSRGARRPAAVVFDLDGESNPEAALNTLRRLMPAERVLVLTSAAALPADEIRRLGFERLLARPYVIGDVLSHVSAIRAGTGAQPRGG